MKKQKFRINMDLTIINKLQNTIMKIRIYQ